jgi:hypothetical protein
MQVILYENRLNYKLLLKLQCLNQRGWFALYWAVYNFANNNPLRQTEH